MATAQDDVVAVNLKERYGGRGSFCVAHQQHDQDCSTYPNVTATNRMQPRKEQHSPTKVGAFAGVISAFMRTLEGWPLRFVQVK